MMNQLLLKQLEKHFGKNTGNWPEGLDSFLATVSETYDHYAHVYGATELAGVGCCFVPVKDTDVAVAPGDDNYPELMHMSALLATETQRRRLAELQCHNREAHLKASQRIANVGSWEVNIRDGQLLDEEHYWSDETFRIMGYEPQNPVLNMFFCRVHPEDLAMVQKALNEAISNRKTYSVEHRLVMPDGTIKLVCERGKIFLGADSMPYKMIGTIQDITSMKASEQQLEKASQELRMLFDNMHEAFFSVDMENYRLIQISAACERIYGYTVADFEANLNLWKEVILEEDMHVIDENEVIMREGRSIVNEYRITHRDGSIKWLETRIEPTMNSDGKLVRLDGITSDITLRKDMEIALRNSEYKFRSLIQNSSDAITVINKDMEITFASDSVSRITGVGYGNVVGTRSQFFTHPLDREKMEAFMRELLENPGERRRVTYRILKKDGSFVWCDRVSVNLLHDPTVLGIVSNFRDITEQKRYEEALQASNEELKKSNMELDKFVYSASHDLRAPLSSMMGIINIVEMETELSEVMEYMGLMKKSIRKLDGFISDILDYSRNARMAIEPQEINLSELVADITGNLKFMDATQPVHVAVQTAGDFPMFSDKSRMAIILNNLISNAIRYHDPARGASQVIVRLTTTAANCVMEVEDNGIGIEEQEQKKVFDMFYRVSKKSIGSGLGLYIVKEAVEKLGGTVGLSSKPGTGTIFRITVPNLI